MPNSALLHKTRSHIMKNPNEWDQTHWIAETDHGIIGCFAGLTCLLAGYTPLLNEVPVQLGHLRATATRVSDGESEFEIDDLARKLLGLDVDQTVGLFNATTTFADIDRIVNNLTENATQTPALP